MAYDKHLADRVRNALGETKGVTERKMFGGLCYLTHGHMTAGIVGPTLMLRVGPAAYAKALSRPHARPMDFTGRPLAGMVYVDPPGIATSASLRAWLDVALSFVTTLPPKPQDGKKKIRVTGRA